MTRPSHLDELMRQAEGADEWTDEPIVFVPHGGSYAVLVRRDMSPGGVTYVDDHWPGWARALVLLIAMAFGVAVTAGVSWLGSWVLS